jgi:hypothetical protein
MSKVLWKSRKIYEKDIKGKREIKRNYKFQAMGNEIYNKGTRESC